MTFLAWSAFLVVGSPIASAAAFTPPFELLKNHFEIEVKADGSYQDTREYAYRVLTEQGAKTLRQIQLSYTAGYQDYRVDEAYTLKKDGTRVDVDRRKILRGYGASTSPGFQALQTITIVFPDVEVGDQVVITTTFNQIKAWFGNSFSEEFVYGQELPAHDVSIALIMPSSMSPQIDMTGMKADAPQRSDDKTRRVWHYEHNTAEEPDSDGVDAYDRGARLVVSTFRNYHEMADVYSGMIGDRAAVTPEIQALADQLTSGARDERDQARAVYEWVSLHIAYVNIVLGAGGFVPHRAAEVLANKFGDCKDHVILLQALLAAKGISSSPVLINANNRFTLSAAPSPYAFNHLITYVPKMHLYLDSTARYAPFGVLPFSDLGKPVVQIASGQQTRTPSNDPAELRSVEDVTIAADGSVDGETHVTASGTPAADMRAIVDAIKASGEANYFQQWLGSGSDASLDAGNIGDLLQTYAFSAKYHEPNALNLPGPGTISYRVVYKPFSFTGIIANSLPPARNAAYVCASMRAEEDLTFHIPANMQILALPKSETISDDEIQMSFSYTKVDARTIQGKWVLVTTHPAATCTPAYYAKTRATLMKMAAALRSEILYQ